MDLQIKIIVFSIFLGTLGVVLATVSLFANLRNKKLIGELLIQTDEIETDFRTTLSDLDRDDLRTMDHARRIAWLETRVRKPEKLKSEDSPHNVFAQKKSAALNMTERRHRVLTLAKRGQDAPTIASSLGMLIGEVELIMNLGRGSGHYV